MAHIRPLIFWTFTGLFLITAGTVVFYAFGYRFNFERGIFISTGSLSIKATPETVDIRVDSAIIPRNKLGILNNAILVSGLTPGEHFVEVTAPGYLPWSKKALIQSGISTEFWNILLVKASDTPETIASLDSVEKIFPAPDQNLLAVVRNKDGTLTVNVSNTATGENDQVFALSEAALPSNEENIEWSPDNQKLIIPTERDSVRSYAIVNLQNRENLSTQSLVSTSGDIRNPRWDSTTRNFVFYIANNVLYRSDTEAPEPLPTLVKNNIAAYDISGNSLYYLSQDTGIVYRILANRPDAEPIQITTVPLDINAHTSYALIAYDDERIAIREREAGKLWIYNKLSTTETIFRQIAGRDIRGVQFSDDGKKLLFFTDNEVSVYFTRVWDTQPTREQDSILQVVRFSSLLRNAQWTEDYEHVIFTLNGNVKMAELDHRDHRNITELLTFPTAVDQVLSRFGEQRIYFVPETGTLQYIQFPPSQTNIFGF